MPLFVLAACAFVQAQDRNIDIPYQKFVLDNGLTLIVHEDHKAPIVAVNVWYHVGSKNEKPGKTGFAHLFEHLMFGGSQHAPGSYIKELVMIGDRAKIEAGIRELHYGEIRFVDADGNPI